MKRMALSYNGDMMKIANPGGTVTIADDHGNAFVMKGNLVVRLAKDPRTCKHENLYRPIIHANPSDDVWVCQDCGCEIDEDGDVVMSNEIKF